MGGMPAAEPRYCVAQVVVETRDAWDRFCQREHINRTVLADVIGLWLDAEEPMPPALQELVNAALDLQDQRRRRG